jgi:hypothetical protein
MVRPCRALGGYAALRRGAHRRQPVEAPASEYGGGAVLVRGPHQFDVALPGQLGVDKVVHGVLSGRVQRQVAVPRTVHPGAGTPLPSA